MKLKPGYTLTEVGVIPEEWEVKTLSHHFRIYAGGYVPKHSLSETRSETHPYPIFANALQNRGLYGFTSEQRAKGNSLTITARGYLGHAEYRDEDFFPIVRLLVLEPTGDLDARFTTFAVNDRVKFAFESTGVPQLTAPQVGKYSVAAPPLPEQHAIAEALSDVDALLAALDQLIAKKRDLKQATMQQLLTGAIRLPGFRGEWEVRRLGEIVEIKKGQLITNDTRVSGDIPVIAGGKQPAYYHNTANRHGRTITISGSGANAGYVALYNTPIFASDCSTISEGSDYSLNFIYYQLMLKQQDIYKTQTGGAQPHIHPSDVAPIEIAIPPLPEQTAITEILGEMDAEILALEERRKKTAGIKQGMMQELLTGRLRLV